MKRLPHFGLLAAVLLSAPLALRAAEPQPVTPTTFGKGFQWENAKGLSYELIASDKITMLTAPATRPPADNKILTRTITSVFTITNVAPAHDGFWQLSIHASFRMESPDGLAGKQGAINDQFDFTLLADAYGNVPPPKPVSPLPDNPGITDPFAVGTAPPKTQPKGEVVIIPPPQDQPQIVAPAPKEPTPADPTTAFIEKEVRPALVESFTKFVLVPLPSPAFIGSTWCRAGNSPGEHEPDDTTWSVESITDTVITLHGDLKKIHREFPNLDQGASPARLYTFNESILFDKTRGLVSSRTAQSASSDSSSRSTDTIKLTLIENQVPKR